MRRLPFLLSLAGAVHAQSTVIMGTRTAVIPSSIDGLPTGTSLSYLSYSSTRTQSSSSVSDLTATLSSNGTARSTSASATLLVGTRSLEAEATVSAVPSPTNTQPCNNYVEFCERKYSNITFVGAHNSPFAISNNAASNQDFGVLAQLDDGIRMLQGQTHMLDGVLRYCHTSCSLLNAGTVEEYFRNVSSWLDSHPYEVVTILIGNSDSRPVTDYEAPIKASGLGKYVYTPPVVPMSLSDWPTLGELIIRRARAIIFMDYNANQDSVPYILDEFSQLWETPFSPTNRSFPCTVQRPPGLSDEKAADRLYMANHNLNTNITVAGISLLLPNTVQINETNAESGFGSLGRAVDNCEGNEPHCSIYSETEAHQNQILGTAPQTFFL